MPNTISVYYFKNNGVGHISVYDGAYYYSYFGRNTDYEFVKNAEACSAKAKYSLFETKGKWQLKSLGEECDLDTVPGLEAKLKNFSSVNDLTKQDQLEVKKILFATERFSSRWIWECSNDEEADEFAIGSTPSYGMLIKTVIPMSSDLDVKQVNDDMKDKHHILDYDWIDQNCATVALSVLNAHKLFSEEKKDVLPSAAMNDICDAALLKVRNLLEQERKSEKFSIQDMKSYLLNCKTELNDKKFDALTFFKEVPAGVSKLRKILSADSKDFNKMSDLQIRSLFDDFLQKLSQQYYAKRGFYWKRSPETQELYDMLFDNFINTFVAPKKPKNDMIFDDSKEPFPMQSK